MIPERLEDCIKDSLVSRFGENDVDVVLETSHLNHRQDIQGALRLCRLFVGTCSNGAIAKTGQSSAGAG
jgi:hypothetical protein